MTREQKLALIIGFSLVLLVGVLVSDHLSGARTAQLADVGAALEASAPPPLEEPLPEYHASPEPAPREPVFTSPPRADQEAGPPRQQPSPGRIASADDSASDSFLRALQEQFRRTSEIAPPAAQVDSARGRSALPEPRVVDPVVQDQRPPAVASYRVKKGDSLWSIAEDHYGDGALAPKVAEFNVDRGRMRDADTILVGATILLPEPRALDASASARPVRVAERNEPPRKYTVRKGDTLGEIAQRELGSTRRVSAILAANRTLIDDPDDIRVGMVLRLPS